MRGNSSKGRSSRKTKAQLSEENDSLRRRVRELEQENQGLEKGKRPDRLSEAVQRIYKEVPIGLCHFDTDLRYWHINEWLAALNGLSVEDHLGRSIGEVLPHVAAGVESQLRHVIETGEPILGGTVDAETPAQPGVTRSFQHSYLPVRSDDDAVVGVSCIVEEITERKKLEDKLRQAQKMEVLGQLTGGVAHEFNNMLQAVVANLDLAEGKLEGMNVPREMVRKARMAAIRGRELTGQLLSYTGKRPVFPQTFDVGLLVSNASNLLRPMLGETFEIETVIADNLRPIHVDRGQLESALVNLAVNARDAMPKGGKITIEAQNTHIDEAYAATRDYDVKTGDYVMMAVSDVGTGMLPEVAKQAFDPFFTTKEVGQGTGLGLSMVYGFVIRQSDGHVDIESEEGRGTTVRLYFPAAETAEEEASEVAEEREPRKAGAGTVLVVEDNADVLEAMSMMLEGLGYTVVTAKDAHEALDSLIDIERLDILLTDIIMPGGVHGCELADAVRKASPETKVVFMSGYPDHELVAKGIIDPRVDVLYKPFDKEELTRKLEEASQG